MKRRPFLTGFIFIAVFCIIFVAMVWAMARFNLLESVRRGSGEKVAVVEVKGIINSSQETIKRIHELRDDRSVKAIVLRIDSPGGAVGPAQEIYAELIKLQDHKPTVTSMGSVAASGGYYIAAGTQKIFANPGTITGSIGVLIEVANIQELLEKIGLRTDVIKSGDYKDTLSPTRDMHSDERSMLQAVIDSIHNQFVEAISLGRDMPREDVLALADGRIFSGEQALQAGLIDELGNLHDAIRFAARLADITDEPDVLYPRRKRPSLLDLIMEAGLQALLKQHRGMTAQYIMQR